MKPSLVCLDRQYTLREIDESVSTASDDKSRISFECHLRIQVRRGVANRLRIWWL